MKRYYFDVRNTEIDAPDEEGIELAHDEAAHQHAVASIRSIVADEVRNGRIDLDGRVEIHDVDGHGVATVHFPDAFDYLCIGSNRSESGPPK